MGHFVLVCAPGVSFVPSSCERCFLLSKLGPIQSLIIYSLVWCVPFHLILSCRACAKLRFLRFEHAINAVHVTNAISLELAESGETHKTNKLQMLHCTQAYIWCSVCSLSPCSHYVCVPSHDYCAAISRCWCSFVRVAYGLGRLLLDWCERTGNVQIVCVLIMRIDH